MRVFESVEDFTALVGTELGVSEWITIDQKRINQFAESTGDHQWIHVDPAKAAQGPFGATIAHGLLTLSLVPALTKQIYRVDFARMALNYGLNKVRFPAPVPVNSRVRARSTLLRIEPVPEGIQVIVSTTMEVEGASKPVCVAETISRYLL